MIYVFVEDYYTELKRIVTDDLKKEIVAFGNSDGGAIYVGIYVRQGTASAPASEALIRKLIKVTDGERYESMRFFDQELSFTALENEFKNRNLSLENSNMKTLGLINKNNLYTNLGFLLSDQCSHTTKIATFQGITKEVFLDRDEFTGSLIKQLHEAFSFIQRNNKLKVNIEELYRTEQYDYPIVAIREALLNAIVHREYGLSASTLISLFEDRLEIVSVGGLAGGITLNDILLGVSITRNEKLAAVFYRLKLIEAYGTGISKIMEIFIALY